MRFIEAPRCQCCRYSRATILVFDWIMICDQCRVNTFNWMRANGFLLSRPHVFTDEFFGPTQQPPVKLVLDIQD